MVAQALGRFTEMQRGMHAERENCLLRSLRAALDQLRPSVARLACSRDPNSRSMLRIAGLQAAGGMGRRAAAGLSLRQLRPLQAAASDAQARGAACARDSRRAGALALLPPLPPPPRRRHCCLPSPLSVCRLCRLHSSRLSTS